MAEVQLKAAKRDGRGKGAARQARMAGKVPAVLYGRQLDPVAIEVDRRAFVAALNTDAGMNVLLDIQLDGNSVTALTKDLQVDPVAGTVLHADFIRVDVTQAVEVSVPVHTVGEAPGAKEGGVVDQTLHEVTISVRPDQVPEAIEADISSLNIGDTLRVGDLTLEGRFEILSDPEEVVLSVTAPISEEELAALEAEAGIVQEPSDAEQEAAAEAGGAGAEEVPESPDEASE
jgi:large subunit ribosomal protein L25